MSAPDGRVAFAEPAAQGLVREGRLDPRWVSAFFSLPRAERTDEIVWSPEFFALRQ